MTHSPRSQPNQADCRFTAPLGRVAKVAVLAVAASVVCLPSGSASASTLYTITGRGFGHGVGMSQYGAQGYARHGWTYRQILAHYFQSTNTSTPVSNVTMRVLVRGQASRTSLTSAARFNVYDEHSARRKGIVAGHVVSVRAYSGKLRVVDLTSGAVVGTYTGPVRISPTSSRLRMLSANSNGRSGVAYRGFLRFLLRQSLLRVVNHVSLESYLRGVVPREMMPSWHMEALKAQAVAARSYAVAHRQSGGDFDVYSTTSSQYYGGSSVEEARTDTAVARTPGVVLRYGSRIIPAYFHSTSGGKTENIENVWGGSAVAWAKGVLDPYDTISPYHSWPQNPIRYWPTQLDAKLGTYVRGTLRGAMVTATGVSPRARVVRIRGSRGDRYVTGSAVRTRLGLKSTWFSIRAMSIASSSRGVLYGRSLALSGRAAPPPTANSKGEKFITLKARRITSSRWTTSPQKTAADGDFYRSVRPFGTTLYRTSLGWAASPPVKVWVRAIVTLYASTYRGRVGQRISLTGAVAPNHRRAYVTVKYYSAGRWRLFAKDQLNAESRYSVAFTPSKAGTYYFATTFPSHSDHAGNSSPVRTIIVK